MTFTHSSSGRPSQGLARSSSVALALFLAGSALATAPSTRIDCGRTSQIVFNDQVLDSAGRRNLDIFIICADGSGRRRITDSPSSDGAPAWSPDGSKIAFISDRDDPARRTGVPASYLYVMDADGRNVRRVIDRFVGGFSWSPDGKRFALISLPDLTAADSADFNRWLFKRDVFVVNADGTGLTNITNSPGSENFPIWSPDGREIAFAWRGQLGDRALGIAAKTPDEDWSEVYVMKSDGTGARRLTFNKLGLGDLCCEDTGPRWSPDGNSITFISKRDGNSEIYRMRRDGSHQQRLTVDSTFDGYPAWSADGRFIAFNKHVAAVRGGPGRTPDSLYVMNADGSHRRALGASGSRPDWRPK